MGRCKETKRRNYSYPVDNHRALRIRTGCVSENIRFKSGAKWQGYEKCINLGIHHRENTFLIKWMMVKFVIGWKTNKFRRLGWQHGDEIQKCSHVSCVDIGCPLYKSIRIFLGRGRERRGVSRTYWNMSNWRLQVAPPSFSNTGKFALFEFWTWFPFSLKEFNGVKAKI